MGYCCCYVELGRFVHWTGSCVKLQFTYQWATSLWDQSLNPTCHKSATESLPVIWYHWHLFLSFTRLHPGAKPGENGDHRTCCHFSGNAVCVMAHLPKLSRRYTHGQPPWPSASFHLPRCVEPSSCYGVSCLSPGNMYDVLGRQAWKRLAHMAETYGPAMTIKGVLWVRPCTGSD